MCTGLREEMAQSHGRGKGEEEEEYIRVEVAMEEHGLQVHVRWFFQASVDDIRHSSGNC